MRSPSPVRPPRSRPTTSSTAMSSTRSWTRRPPERPAVGFTDLSDELPTHTPPGLPSANQGSAQSQHPSRGFAPAITAGIVTLVLVVGRVSFGVGGQFVPPDPIAPPAAQFPSPHSLPPPTTPAFCPLHHTS